MSASRAQVETTLSAYLRCWSEDDRAGWLDLFDPEASVEDPVGSPPHQGVEAIGAFWDRVHQGEMSIRCELHRIVTCGDEALMIFDVITAGAGVEMRVQIADLFTFNAQGKIATMKAYWDERCLSMAS